MQAETLLEIPLIDIPAGSEPAVVSVMAEPARLSLLLSSARRIYTPPGVWIADSLTQAWAGRAAGPYSGAVVAVDRIMRRRGAYLLNHSYEWGCTSSAMKDPDLGGSTLLRTLDWPFDGLGRALIVTRCDGGAGRYFSMTWPGFVGVLTGLAPRRFAIAINQPPLPLPGWGKAAGWLAARRQVHRSTAIAPAHLLRLVFDTCPDFTGAVTLIRQTPLCIPAIFTIAGAHPDEAVVIERTATDAFEPAEAVAANHWSSLRAPAGRPRHHSSASRHKAMCDLAAATPDWSLNWVRPPIAQPDTRVVVMANPATGRLLVQGWEKRGPATALLDTQ